MTSRRYKYFIFFSQEQNESVTIASNNIIKLNFSNINETFNNDTMTNITMIRVKRQQTSGASNKLFFIYFSYL